MNQEKYHNTGVWKLIRELENKKGISEISINGPREIFIERDGKLIQLAYDLSKQDINNFVKDLIDSRQKKYGIVEESPVINGSLYDGSRYNVIKEPFAHGSHAISIRKYLKTIGSILFSGKFITEPYKGFPGNFLLASIIADDELKKICDR